MACQSISHLVVLYFAGVSMVVADNEVNTHGDGFLAPREPVTDAGSSWLPPLDTFYHASLIPLAAVTIVLGWYTRPKAGSEPLPPGFWQHQWKYVAVWAPAIMADWFQGPYVYALYASYGYSSVDIAELFVAGFGASMVFGTFVGSVADAWGRKRCAVLYCVLYIASCFTKHSSDYGILIVGRITGGIATSLLFSTFECWLVAEHCQRRAYSSSLLRYMFGIMFFVQYLTAIIAGVVAQAAADTMELTKVPGYTSIHYGGYTAPFDLSSLTLMITIPLICFLWEENYGDEQSGAGPVQSLVSATQVMRSNWRIWMLGVVVSCFEGSMFAFVFNWTPALESEAVPPPYGLIFSSFMMACMCGSSIFSLIDSSTPPVRILLPLFIVATASLSVCNFFVGTTHLGFVFAGFLLFEFCVGIYFPAMGSLKSDVVPEEARAGVYNIFRVPLNAVVVGLLLTHLSTRTALGFCSALLVLASLGLSSLMWNGTEAKCVEKVK